MAKKKNVSEQPKAEAAAPVVEGNLKNEAKEQKAPKSGIVTAEGNVIDRIRVFQDGKTTKVQVDYGKYNTAGKTETERRKGMRILPPRVLTPEQSKEYQRLSAEDANKAKEYAVRSAYPMHVDEAAFRQKNAEINGRKVDYIIIEKLDPEKLGEGNKNLAGRWQLSFGEKGNDASRFYGIMNREEIASFKHRGEVTLDDKGQVKSVGAPLTMADIAGRMENRVKAEREAKAAKLEPAQNVNWSQFKFADGVKIDKLHYAPSSDPDHLYIKGKVNGIELSSQLTSTQTLALKNKMATLDQVAAANFDFRAKVSSILGGIQVLAPKADQAQAETKGIDKQAVVDVIVARTSSQSAKSFTDDQVKALNDYAEAAGARDPETREQIFEDLWKTAEPSLKGVNEKWQEDARAELKDLAQGNVRAEQQGMHR